MSLKDIQLLHLMQFGEAREAFRDQDSTSFTGHFHLRSGDISFARCLVFGIPAFEWKNICQRIFRVINCGLQGQFKLLPAYRPEIFECPPPYIFRPSRKILRHLAKAEVLPRICGGCGPPRPDGDGERG